MPYTRVNLTLTLTPQQAAELEQFAKDHGWSRAHAIKNALREYGAIDQEVKS